MFVAHETSSPTFTPAPEPSRPSHEAIALGPSGWTVEIADDPYSDRIRCDHPEAVDGALLGAHLLHEARVRGRGRVVVLCPGVTASGLRKLGYREEAKMPGFYAGERDCHVLGAYPDPDRASPPNLEAVRRVRALARGTRAAPPPAVVTTRATRADAPRLAALLDETFAQYPTPSHDPVYVADAIDRGVPFRFVERRGRMLACASADLVPDAKTAELTDCATRPECRGRGYMQQLLADLMEDLRGMGYTSAFTLARASVPGVNVAFARRGFQYRGTMPQSCRIGRGIEDMNVWSRRLPRPE